MLSSRNSLAICLFFSLVAIASCKIRGMAFSTGHDLYGYRQAHANVSLDNLKKTCANYVHISAYTKMNNINATSAYQETDDDSIRYIIRVSKSKGFKVFLKPVVEIKNHVWRGFLPARQQWFRKLYTPFIMKMARIAQQENVDLFSVGSEYRGTEANKREWLRIIKKVKTVYSGKTTYVGNHDSYKRIEFWHSLNYISIAGYWRLQRGEFGPSPNLEETKRLWRKEADEVNAWRISSGHGRKQVLIAEIGAQSKGNGVVYRTPWKWTAKGPVNFFEQVKMYEGLLNAFMAPAWSKGVILWNWELWPEAGIGPPANKWYTPQNKPAERVMTRIFKKYSNRSY